MDRLSVSPVLFRKMPGTMDYPETVLGMETHVSRMLAGLASEEVWLLEHPAIYTLGSGAKEADILTLVKLPLYKTGRGGQITYHGPGQRVAYIMIDLARRGRDLRRYVWLLEEGLILTLKDLGVVGERRPARVGVWVCGSRDGQEREEKIAAIGVRIKKWITFHGISLNVNPDLAHYHPIVPCGLADYGVTSLHKLGIKVTLEEVDQRLEKNFRQLFEIRPPF